MPGLHPVKPPVIQMQLHQECMISFRSTQLSRLVSLRQTHSLIVSWSLCAGLHPDRSIMLPLLRSKGVSLAGYIQSLAPIGYWKLDELSGSTALNYGTLGAAGNGAYSGPTLAKVAS